MIIRAENSLTATIARTAEGGRQEDKRQTLSAHLFRIVDGAPVEVAILRGWSPAKSYGGTSWASLWMLDGAGRSGHGKASGYGYHRESQAVANAIESAGFDLSEDIGGRGDSFYADALAACARACGIEGPFFYIRAV